MEAPPHDTTCPNCQEASHLQDNFCGICAYPLSGNFDAKQRFILTQSEEETGQNLSYSRVLIARAVLISIGVYFLLIGLVGILDRTSTTNGFSLFLMTGVFTALAIWTRRNPLAAILCGLGIYLTIDLTGFFLYPSAFFDQWVLKAITYAGLITGLLSAIGAQKEKLAELTGREDPANE